MTHARFAAATAGFDDAHFVLFGAPYDATRSIRAGTREGPGEIRGLSHALDTFNLRTGIDLVDVPIHDMGDVAVTEKTAPGEMVQLVREAASRIVAGGKFPVLLGGEHSATPPVLEALAKRESELTCILLDAHLDYRDEFEGVRESHACTAKRIAEIVGPKRLAILGARSASKAEWDAVRRDGVFFLTSFDLRAMGMSRALAETQKALGDRPVYLTVDLDAIDPAYAPAVGTPEPYGLSPQDVVVVMQRFARRLVGFDLMEVSPRHDTGKSSALAARLVSEAIAEAWSKRSG